MTRLYAQGDILVERVDDAPVSGRILRSVDAGAVVVAEGEVTGHCHRIFGSVTMYRDDALAREVPFNLYVAHARISGSDASLMHDEHAPITLEPGTYRVRRQRQLEPTDVGVYADGDVLED